MHKNLGEIRRKIMYNLLDGCMVGWLDSRMVGWSYSWSDSQMVGLLDGWMVQKAEYTKLGWANGPSKASSSFVPHRTKNFVY